MGGAMYGFDPLEPEDPRTVGGYPLRARIGAGGMGRVYLSFTPGGRAVAVKIIRREFGSDPEFRERFAREVSIAQQVNGIHIAQLIDAGSDNGVPWLAGAYVAGPSLAQAVAEAGPLPAHTVLALAGRIAESLAAIHATGMVHRDLKPGNILLDESGPKVIDFGIVRAATPTATGRSSHRTFIGSPPFMAPEQIRGQKVTPATDVFALGATLYYLCTGESAFAADFADGVLYRVIHDEPDYEALPEQVRELIRVCLRKEPAERPSTQRIIEGCRAAGAGPETPLPDAVLAMIRERARALGDLAGAKDADQTVVDDETVGEPMDETAAERTPEIPDVHAMTTVTPEATPLIELSGEPPAPARRPRRGRTALVAGTSSLATAVAAVVVAALVWPHSTTTNPNNPVQPTGHSGSGTQASSNPATSAPATLAGGDAVQWHGQVMITVNQVDLDSVPVNNGASSQVSLYDSTISISGDGPYQLTALPGGAATLATWTGTGTPSRGQCYDQVSSQGVEQVTVSNGTMVCDITVGNRVALLKVLDDTADNGNGILTEVTVWSGLISTASAGASSN
ncbi:MAG TPA: serine/threonine-protein kinase [Actinospica sp.]|nr:serine/threonine-protein kinase [Actinospica sp.]